MFANKKEANTKIELSGKKWNHVKMSKKFVKKVRLEFLGNIIIMFAALLAVLSRGTIGRIGFSFLCSCVFLYSMKWGEHSIWDLMQLVFLYLYFCTWWHVANVWFDFWCNWQDFWLKHFWRMMVIRTCQLLWFLYPHLKCDFNPIDQAKTTKNIEYWLKTKCFSVKS